MTFRLLLTVTLFTISLFAVAQPGKLSINSNILLPQDTTERRLVIAQLNDFLTAAQGPNEENKLVLESEKIETFILLDEVNGIEKSARFKDDNFFKPYLTNIVPLKEGYLIQISYIGVNENAPILRASFTFLAHKGDKGYLFSSPLKRNTKNWKSVTTNNNTFHYQSELNQKKLQEFNKLTSTFDKKLKAEKKISEFYCAGNFVDMLKLIGVDYKADYNGRNEGVFSSSFGDRKLIALGNNNATFDTFDTHDLWHDRLSLVIPRSQVNKPIDEGCAYLYGGSWGLTWKEIWTAFKTQVASNKDANWAEYKEKPVYFNTAGYNNSADYIVNALLVQKIEKEKGFAGVWEFLNCGKFEAGNENYYKALEKLTGITKANYNEKVWTLINNEK